MRGLCLAVVVLGAALPLAAPAAAQAPPDEVVTVIAPGGGTPATSDNFRLVGHEPLFARGMNAAIAVHEDFVYVGNRTDPAPGRPHPGILVVDAGNPSDPHVVGEIGPPYAANDGETTRELRVWQRQKLLIVLSFPCSPSTHSCSGADAMHTYRFFDLSDPAEPRFLMEYETHQADGAPRTPHEFFLWEDPKDPDRALLWTSTPTSSANAATANLVIYDISGVRAGVAPVPVAEGNWNNQFDTGGQTLPFFDGRLALHSMAPTVDGKVTHLAYQRGNYLALDTSKVAAGEMAPGAVENLNDDLITQPADRPIWGSAIDGCIRECAESHTSLQVPGRALELNTDEIYGTATLPFHGCPWGWMRLIDTSDPAHPSIVSEYRLRQNQISFCDGPELDPLTQQFTSYASHNPTVLRHLALITWHSGGFQAIDITKASRPRQAGWFSPRPLPTVATEDPRLGGGPNKVIMWSYPIIKDGLVYAVDVRNGLYILDYRGPHRGEVAQIDFLEGNSNLGDARRLAARGAP
jgi:hypothetical protein